MFESKYTKGKKIDNVGKKNDHLNLWDGDYYKYYNH